ncbi:MAG: hypothetical protein E7295_10365 [Lachnospiraceae bacterium]|jgi:hypothetical protein|nr:hypothetical protein [Lachnospiraceae bacterium]
MKRTKALPLCLLSLLSLTLISCGGGKDGTETNTIQHEEFISSNTGAPRESKYPYETKSSYMIYYGVLNDDIIDEAKQYEVFILHPKMGDITREQVQEIRSSGTIVLGYIAIGEDLRTANLTPEEILKDDRFIGDGTGPRVDPRPAGTTALDGVDPLGVSSPGGTGYASYFLDDNDHNGKPDINPVFNCAFTNIGDPAWFEVLNQMTIDGFDKIPGIKEILSDDYGRGLGCDGLFLDTIDTCAPNSYTTDDSFNKTRFEWTATGVADFMARVKEAYPNKLLLQNRGIFFYNPQLPHYKYNPRHYVDYVMYESYHLDSNTNTLYTEAFSKDNRYNYGPKLIAEASRPDGFQVLSLGYAEGPEEYHLKETLFDKSTAGLDILMEDVTYAQDAGFMHYITDGSVTLVNDFVIHHESKEDSTAPVWNSTYNSSPVWPPEAPTPRVGIQEVQAEKGGVTIRWDIATDKNPVTYVLYYQTKPFDFDADPELTGAESIELIPEIGDGYENGVGPNIYPNQATVSGLESKKTYYFLLRARDASENHNEDDNQIVKTCVPK